MSSEDLERYETEVELALYQEYRSVISMFRYVVETERRFYLANQVTVEPPSEETGSFVRVTLEDAWVWDMYRPVRFVDHVEVVSFRDVNVETLPPSVTP
ncbi:MAG: DUF2469 family protein [Acidimicrobiales bacterium]|jgi:hypothetical protein